METREKIQGIPTLIPTCQTAQGVPGHGSGGGGAQVDGRLVGGDLGLGSGQEGVAVSRRLQGFLLDGRAGQGLRAQAVQRAARVLVLGHVACQVGLLMWEGGTDERTVRAGQTDGQNTTDGRSEHDR